jgi:hypothetical protein
LKTFSWKMERDAFKHMGTFIENDINPTEKICEILKYKNFEKLIEVIKNSQNAAGALHDSFIPLGKLVF